VLELSSIHIHVESARSSFPSMLNMIAESTEITEGLQPSDKRREEWRFALQSVRQLKRKRAPAGTRSEKELKVGSRYSYGKRALQRKEQNEDAPTKRNDGRVFLKIMPVGVRMRICPSKTIDFIPSYSVLD
jgi:hypothetical protein